MSMFDWHAAPQQAVISHRFWVYWAFTVPVTFLVFIWFYFFVLVDVSGDSITTDATGLPDYSSADIRPGETTFQKLKQRFQRSPDATENDLKRRSLASLLGLRGARNIQSVPTGRAVAEDPEEKILAFGQSQRSP
jgi:hypothetical protein